MIVVFIIFIIGVALFIIQLSRHINIIRQGKAVHRLNAPKARALYTFKTALGQTRIVERPWGWAHVVLMWAFFVFLTSALEMLVACIVPEFTWGSWFGAGFHGFLCVVQTWFAWLSVLAVSFLSIRRMVSKKTFTNFDAVFILTDIFLLMVSHLVCMSAAISMNHVAEGASVLLPIERAIAPIVGENAESVHAVFSAFHLVMMAIFLVWIPNSKHLHIVFAWPDAYFAHRTWFSSSQPSFSPDRVNFEAYEAECERACENGCEKMPTIGLRDFSDTTIKQRLEAFSCTLCKRCTNVCPMVANGLTDRGPMDALVSLRKLCNNNKDVPLIPELMTNDALWACTQCGACDRACPLTHEHSLRILMMRQNAVAQQTDVPQKLTRMFQNAERSANPWGYPKRDRAALLSAAFATSGDEAQNAESPKRGSITIFAGCMASYDKRAAATLAKVVGWLKQEGFEVSMMDGEVCCGEPQRRAGNEMGFEEAARENIKKLEALHSDLVLTTCPHCAFTLTDSYAEFGYKGKVLHIVQFWRTLNDAKNLRFEPGDKKSIALQMPCYLSKYNDETRGVVALLDASGFDVKQTSDARISSCCGAGGTRFFWSDERKITKARVSELQNLNAQTIGTLCPFCTQMIDDAVQNSGVDTLSTCTNVIELLTERVHLTRDFNLK